MNSGEHYGGGSICVGVSRIQVLGQARGWHPLIVLSARSPAAFTKVFVGRMMSSTAFAV